MFLTKLKKQLRSICNIIFTNWRQLLFFVINISDSITVPDPPLETPPDYAKSTATHPKAKRL